ncbi:MAG: hypothetical protein JXR10_06955 [Cyclobacteriaceae bacterium]
MVKILNPQIQLLTEHEEESLFISVNFGGLRTEEVFSFLSNDQRKIILISSFLHRAIEKVFGEFDENANFNDEEIWSSITDKSTEMACYDDEVEIRDLTVQCEALMVYRQIGGQSHFEAYRNTSGIYVDHEKYKQPFTGNFDTFSGNARNAMEAIAQVFIVEFRADAPEAERLRLLEKIDEGLCI